MTKIFYTHPKTKLIDIHAVTERIPYSRTTIYRLRKRGEFPEPVQLGPNRVAWLESDIDQWIEDRVSGKSSSVTEPTNVIDFSPRSFAPENSNGFVMSMVSSNTMVSNTA